MSDNWVVVFFNGENPHYRLLTGTSGGYTTGSSWRMNSGIVGIEEDDNFYVFKGASGSTYLCRKQAYCLRKNNAYIWTRLQELHGEKVKLLDEETDWMKLDWVIE